jgi:hypothetical protein
MLRRIFGTKREEVTGEWRKLHNEELNDVHPSPSIVRLMISRMRWAGHVGCMGRREACIGLWWGSLRGKRPLGRTRHRWEDNIKMDIKEVECRVIYWIELV